MGKDSIQCAKPQGSKTAYSRQEAIRMFGENGFYPTMSGGRLIFRQEPPTKLRHLPIESIDSIDAGFGHA